MQEAVGRAAEDDAAHGAVVRGADHEQAGVTLLGDVVENVRGRRAGACHGLELDAVERRLDGREAGERGAAVLVPVGIASADPDGALHGVRSHGDDGRARGAGEQCGEDGRLRIVAQGIDADDDGRCHDDLPEVGVAATAGARRCDPAAVV